MVDPPGRLTVIRGEQPTPEGLGVGEGDLIWLSQSAG